MKSIQLILVLMALHTHGYCQELNFIIDDSAMSGMPWDLLERNPNELYNGKSISDVQDFDTMVATLSPQSGMTNDELRTLGSTLAKLGKIVKVNPMFKIHQSNRYFMYILWNNGGIVGYIHVIGDIKYVVTIFKNCKPINFVYEL
jgi:hypothetical protein